MDFNNAFRVGGIETLTREGHFEIGRILHQIPGEEARGAEGRPESQWSSELAGY
jgi:hypothetical protein